MPDTEDQPIVSEQGVALNSAMATLSGLPSVVDRDPVLLEIECYGVLAQAHAALAEDERPEFTDATRMAVSKALPPTSSPCPGATAQGGHCSALLKPRAGTCVTTFVTSFP